MIVEVTDETWDDVATAIRVYDLKPDKHGANVRAEFGRALAAIGANPQLYPLVEDEYPGVEVREYPITRFEQRVIYLIEENRVLVIAFVHATRRPRAWHRRLSPNI